MKRQRPGPISSTRDLREDQPPTSRSPGRRLGLGTGLWIAWCIAWAAFWAGAGLYTAGITWILVPFSLAAILLAFAGDGGPWESLNRRRRRDPGEVR